MQTAKKEYRGFLPINRREMERHKTAKQRQQWQNTEPEQEGHFKSLAITAQKAAILQAKGGNKHVRI